MSDIVLVHGSTQSAEGFRRLSGALSRQGHRVVAVEIPGGSCSSVDEYAEVLVGQVPRDLERPVVAAHSVAGLLLPALARRLDACHQVWLAAVVANHVGGQSLLAEIGDDPTAVFNPEWLGVDPTTDPVLATYFLFHDADLATCYPPWTARCPRHGWSGSRGSGWVSNQQRSRAGTTVTSPDTMRSPPSSMRCPSKAEHHLRHGFRRGGISGRSLAEPPSHRDR